MKYLSILFSLLFGLTGFAQNKTIGKDYSVSPNGNDANNGSKSHPFKTIMAAANMAMPGDTITVYAGIYREQITPPRGGNSDQQRIVYRAAKGGKVIIKGSEMMKGWKKLQGDTWEVKIPNSFFGAFNPYKELIHGDWFFPTPKGRKYHRGAVYLNGDWLMEAAKKEQVMQSADAKNCLWWGDVDSTATTIWAQFKNVDPNKELTEINVRPTVFYPDKPFIDYITVDGFTMEQAATNWAPPTAEQMGIIGTHWSKGWIIENNAVLYSKCVGIALGKYGDEYDNMQTESAEGYMGTIKRALAFGWNKATVGSHIVRNNTIAYCEQAGIVGSMGCAFSVVQGNIIHDIYVRRLFNGAEQAAIKFHGGVDVRISGNLIYRSINGVFLDWMGQGAQINNNLMYGNSRDLFLEVNHGPILLSNNILLSRISLITYSQGVAFVHNLFSGKAEVVHYDRRLTPYLKPHSTDIAGLHDNPSGDVRFINNLFVNGADVSRYSEALLPVVFDGNVYTKGTVRLHTTPLLQDGGKVNDRMQGEEMYKDQPAVETNAVADTTFDAGVHLQQQGGSFYLELALEQKWLRQKRKIITSALLGKALIPQLPFENPDCSLVLINTDYTGKKRNLANPSPGPFEIKGSGMRKIRVW